MTLTVEILLVLLTYVWGSIPYGFILTKIYTGKNILELGSGNVGSINFLLFICLCISDHFDAQEEYPPVVAQRGTPFIIRYLDNTNSLYAVFAGK
jgi:hypothetical protein